MNDKTDLQNEIKPTVKLSNEMFSKGFIIITLIAILVFFIYKIYFDKFLLFLELHSPNGQTVNVLFFPPSFTIWGKMINDAISIFNGKTAEYNFYHSAWILFCIIFNFFISPFLLFSGIKDYYKKKADKAEKYTFSTHHAKIVIGAIFIVWFSFNSILMYSVAKVIYRNNKSENITTAQRDNINSELNQLSVESLEYYILTSELKNNSMSKAAIPEISNLPCCEKLKYGEYIIKPVLNKDTLMVISGISGYSGEKNQFKNSNNRKGRIEAVSIIKPDAGFEILEKN